jgi:hypothetical protein
MRISTPLLLAAVCALPLVLSACATARTNARPDEPASSEWAPSLEGVYARVAAAMYRPGEIYGPTISTVEVSGPNTFTTRTQAWIDLAGSRARGDVEAAFGDVRKTSSWIIDGRAYIQTLEYDPPFMREATTCRDSDDPLLALVLACRAHGERGITVVLDEGDYHGQPAIAVLTQGATDEPGGRTYFTETLFVDPGTYLPIAVEGSGRSETLDASGNVVETLALGRMVYFENAFSAADGVDLAMFDPGAFGYEPADPMVTITKNTPDFTAYWLGEEAAIEKLPAIRLGEAYDATGTNRPALRYRALVTYRDASDEFGSTLLRLEQWRRDEWSDVEGGAWHAWRDAPCVQRKTVDAPEGGLATLYSGYGSGAHEDDCGGSPPTEYSAIVTIGSTVVRISAPEGSPYNSEVGIRAAISALQPAS